MLIVTFLTGCTTLLNDNFESDAIGAAPIGSIPGSPNCDSIDLHGSAAQFSVSPTSALSGNKSLQFEPAFANGESTIDFLPCPSADNAKSMIFRWQGRLEAPDSSPGVQIRLTDSEDALFHAYLVFTVTRTHLEIRSGATVVHTVNGDFRFRHTVIARIVPGTNAYHVAVLGGDISGDGVSFDGELNSNLNFHAPGTIIRMTWREGASVSDIYRIDEVNISRR